MFVRKSAVAVACVAAGVLQWLPAKLCTLGQLECGHVLDAGAGGCWGGGRCSDIWTVTGPLKAAAASFLHATLPEAAFQSFSKAFSTRTTQQVLAQNYVGSKPLKTLHGSLQFETGLQERGAGRYC